MTPIRSLCAAALTLAIAAPAACADMAGMTMAAPAAPTHRPLAWRQADRILATSRHEGVVRHHVVRFPGHAPRITIVANAPHHPDMSFEIAGRTDPTIAVDAGSRVTLTFLNMDYGAGMEHGVVVTRKKPPYPVQPRDMSPVVRTPILGPRSRAALRKAHYAMSQERFTAPRRPGTYYYLCPVPGHASAFHMYGRLRVRPARA